MEILGVISTTVFVYTLLVVWLTDISASGEYIVNFWKGFYKWPLVLLTGRFKDALFSKIVIYAVSLIIYVAWLAFFRYRPDFVYFLIYSVLFIIVLFVLNVFLFKRSCHA
jgi:hypothetical protein